MSELLKHCATCKKEFYTYHKERRNCSLGCGRKYKSVHNSGQWDKKLTFEQNKLIVQWYQEGLSQPKIARRLGVSHKSISYRLRKQGIKGRVYIPENQNGSSNTNWKGDRITYAAAHERVYAAKGSPSLCEKCGITNTSKGRFEWANMTGNYLDVNDYRRLCRSCHVRLDKGRSLFRIYCFGILSLLHSEVAIR